MTWRSASSKRLLARPLGRCFSDLSEPVAAASVAQVHRATVVEDGVTTRRRGQGAAAGHRTAVPARSRRHVFRRATWPKRFPPRRERLNPVGVVETLARSVKIEMDFRLEAAAASEIAENTEGDDDFRVPKVDWDRCAREVLTLEWIDGIPLVRYRGLASPRARSAASSAAP